MKKKQLVMLNKNINDAKKYFFEYDKLEDKAKAYANYCALLDYYESVTGKWLDNLLKEYITDDIRNIYQSLVYHNLDNLVRYKDYHKKISKASFLEIDSFLQRVVDFSCLSDIDYNYRLSKEDNKENWELFFQYLQEHKELADIYFKIALEGNCYFSKYSTGGFFDVNYISEKYILLIGKGNSSLDTVVNIVHELGHASEYQFDVDSHHTFGNLEFMQQNLFSEVISRYFEQDFLEYYLKHTSQKIGGVLKAIDFFNNCKDNLYITYLFSNLDDNSIYQFQGKGVLVEVLKRVTNLDDFDNFDNLVVCGDTEMMYGYGFLISSYLLEHPEKVDRFLGMRREEFSPYLLKELGIEEDNVCDVIDSRCQKVFGKYL